MTRPSRTFLIPYLMISIIIWTVSQNLSINTIVAINFTCLIYMVWIIAHNVDKIQEKYENEK